MQTFVALGLAVLIVILVLVIVLQAVRVVQQGLVGVVKRLGQFHSVREPGVTFLLPFADRLEMIDMREVFARRKKPAG